MANFRDIYDVTAREKTLIEDREARRLRLRNEYLKKYLHPFKPNEGHIFDAPVQRLMSLRATRSEYFKPTLISWLSHTIFIIGPIVLFTIIVKRERDIRENRYRTGQVAYRDRHNKFV